MRRNPRAAAAALFLCSCPLAQAQDTPLPTLPAVVIHADREGDAARRQAEAERAMTPGGVSLVEGEDLRRRNVTSLADMLRYTPGAWAAGGMTGDSTFLSIRGSNLDATHYDGNGVKLLQDGLPVTAADGSNHNRDVDPLSARRAILARGANALTYGASTLGGAIDFITPTARDGEPWEALLATGSHGQRQGRVTVGAVEGDLDALVTAEAKRSRGFRDHQRQEREAVYANAGLRLTPSVHTRFYATHIDNGQQLPGVLSRAQLESDPRAAEAAAVAGDYRLDVQTWRVANKTVWDIDATSSLTAGLSFEEQRLHHPIVHAPPFFSLLIDTTLRNAGASVRYQRRSGGHDLLAGLDLGRTRVRGSNDRYVPGGARTVATHVDNRADNLEAFVVDRWTFAPGWTLVAGTQAVIGHREVRNTAVDGGASAYPRGRYDSLNPRVGLVHDITPTAQVFANLSRTYEAPTLYELQDDARGGDAVLDAMRGLVLEAGTRGAHAVGRHRLHWDAAAYYGRLHGEILSRDDPAAPGTSLSVNVGRTIHAGLEALLGASIALDGKGIHRLEPLVNLTLNAFRFDEDATYGNRRLPAAPRHALRGEVLYRHAGGFFLGPTFDVVGRRYADFANTYEVEGYVLWGLRTGYTAHRWEVFAESRNLADRRYVTTFNVRDRAAPDAAILHPGEPRSLYVGARLKF